MSPDGLEEGNRILEMSQDHCYREDMQGNGRAGDRQTGK